MAYDFSRLADTQYISDSVAAIVTNASGATTYIKLVTLHNPTASAATITLNLVPDSTGSVGTAADGNQIYEQSVAAGETKLIELPNPGWILSDTNDTLQGVCDTASAVTIRVDGGLE